MAAEVSLQRDVWGFHTAVVLITFCNIKPKNHATEVEYYYSKQYFCFRCLKGNFKFERKCIFVSENPY